MVLAVIFTLFYRFGVRIPLRPFFSVTSVLLYYMAFVFMGKGVRELQEGNALPLTAIPGFPHSEFARLYPSWQGVLAQLALLLLFAFAVLKTFWPKRSVTLPTVDARGGGAAAGRDRGDPGGERRAAAASDGARGSDGARAGARGSVLARALAPPPSAVRASRWGRSREGIPASRGGAYTLRASR